MLPIPTHLEGILVPSGDHNDEKRAKGTIRCSCGSEWFHVSTYANTEDGNPQYAEYNGGYAWVISATCKECNNTYTIFDASKHGWNGFVCHDGVPVPDNELKVWICERCGCDVHSVDVSIQSQGKEDFVIELELDEDDAEFQESDWANAFEWITIGLKCYQCKHVEEQWVDCETM